MSLAYQFLAQIGLMILGKKPPLTSLDLNLLPACMVRFHTATLISIGLKPTLGYLIFSNQNYFENDISVIYFLANVKQILNKL